ncbi:hypothetical protein UFOVP330_94 [uncultured Caudovirales phage]|uniref:Uncharacterized protein n=1 Tax=uncultured Caudovirales phage TaxID=2100421 RepID=A0A6J5LWQ2_9CAUD|nr:hypothetical protein UFOVP330_94 [uncultured Caudovirales phage]
MDWVFIWQAYNLNMAYEHYYDMTEEEARKKFFEDHPEDFAFAVICGEKLEMWRFAA